MKIALLIDAWWPIIGGGQKLFWELAKGLVKNHHCQVMIITRALKDEGGNIFAENEFYFKNKLKIIRLGPPLKWTNLFGRFWFTLQSAVFILSHNFDLIHASSFLPGITLQIIKLFKKTPITFSAIGFNHFWQETNPGLKGKLFGIIEEIITEKFNYDWLITDDFDFYKRYQHKHNKKNISFIVNGVELWSKKKEKKWLTFTFLFVGRLEKRKGIKYLLKAFKKVCREFKNVHLRIVGGGEEREECRKLCFRLGIKRKVIFVGRVSEKQKEAEYKKAHCLVLPSLWEGHPLVIFEAWAAKLPIIATRVGSIENFLKEGENGYLVKPKNINELYQKMVKALENNSLSMLGKKGFQLVQNKYRWEVTVRDYFQVFKRLRQ